MLLYTRKQAYSRNNLISSTYPRKPHSRYRASTSIKTCLRCIVDVTASRNWRRNSTTSATVFVDLQNTACSTTTQGGS